MHLPITMANITAIVARSHEIYNNFLHGIVPLTKKLVLQSSSQPSAKRERGTHRDRVYDIHNIYNMFIVWQRNCQDMT